ncbi:type VI secretion system ImpA family N-terminal domain-containing protein [Aeromonas cavernicola]|uniref:Type VI secretion protein n=1 Tax=Aeromonas cavernicola TaxID=1006623 RepID=A0A2H9U7F5_9GAMM|nr:type VI secretion system ImpA family N-terminal domain-containing protein [Aeromonas cavernicola]PJG59931.1 hypothetical protein CUC53_04715 [Aeromonas cavernicola]
MLTTLKVGQDPRMLAEFDAIRLEINKLSHASRPVVDWDKIVQLSTRVLELNGADLQTCLYYTLAKTHVDGLQGFADGLDILAALVSDHWDHFWPSRHQERARVEQMDWFIARVSDVLRQCPVTLEHSALFHRIQHALHILAEALHTQVTGRVPRVENLLHYVESYTGLFEEPAMAVETPDGRIVGTVSTAELRPAHQAVPDRQLNVAPASAAARETGQAHEDRRLVLPMSPAPMIRTSSGNLLKVRPLPAPRHGRWFIGGMAAGMIFGGAVAAAAWWFVEGDRPLMRVEQALQNPALASYELAAQAKASISEQHLREAEPLLMSELSLRLEQLPQRSPSSPWQEGEALLNMMQAIYPSSTTIKGLSQKWQQQLQVAQEQVLIRPVAQEQAVAKRLTSLLDELKRLERERKTVTLSYLKGEVYEMLQLVGKPISSAEQFGMKVRQGESTEQEVAVLSQRLQGWGAKLYELQRRLPAGR